MGERFVKVAGAALLKGRKGKWRKVGIGGPVPLCAAIYARAVSNASRIVLSMSR